ncbi:iron-sulfur cluster assembly scaffold protein [Bremerella cremea]|uniref:Iron-sulfur cluster assembly scaffold protein n=1 Tax=Bremerella cremea TaxID=1031537 RepID=A0A368KQG4_9BACT|nr:iron-sulfur cluster assembly scaffold protein [Bremerella cremea]RCS49125.1 iron-sulfur cluster assembly scaffold protein [Bremerella cremea]
MSDLEWLLTHSRHPYHRGSIEQPCQTGDIASRTCADRVSLQVVVDGPVIQQIWHNAVGCMVCQASISYLCEMFEGLTIDEVQSQTEVDYLEELGTLTPLRQQRALQSFRCLKQILESSATKAS